MHFAKTIYLIFVIQIKIIIQRLHNFRSPLLYHFLIETLSLQLYLGKYTKYIGHVTGLAAHIQYIYILILAVGIKYSEKRL